ncbi:amidohydrolase family protein [Sphingomonas sp. ERG5]|uniref:amidohydrolase family protein n=1 Tax=Sphingomonas sp. ERG5 TaxID=1381597 RepID=UPI00068F4B74|nr:amidohydrolase family protein [Sphingomonas sp. ERG5]
MRNTLILCFAMSLIGLPAIAAERSDLVLAQDHVAGEQAVSDGPDNSIAAHYRYADRDHGEDITARWVLGPDGMPVEYSAMGHDYMRARIDEKFSWDGRFATWSSGAGRDRRDLSAPAFYMPANPVPEYYGVLVRALLKTPGRELALLPSGRARLEEGRSIHVRVGGRTVEWKQYRIGGLRFMPLPVWLDHAGAMVGLASPFLTTIAAGHGADASALLRGQDEDNEAWYARMARELTHDPKGPLLIHNAKLFDPRTLRTEEKMSVFVRDGRIERVGPDGSFPVDAAAGRMDARGHFLMPGMWDVHAHFDGVDGLLDIANGVTSARDIGNDVDLFLKRVARFENGTEVGPTVIKAGFIDREGPYAAPLPTRVRSLDEALKWVDWYAAHGYVQIKTYMSMKPEWIRPIAARAHQLGMRLSGHVPAFMSARQFVEAGADEIQHFNYVELDFLYPRVQETTLLKNRFIEVALHAAENGPETEKAKDLIAFFKRHGTVLDPTMALLETRLAGRPDDVPPGLRGVADRFPSQIRRGLVGGVYEAPKGQEAVYHGAMPAMLALLGAMHRAGVRIMPGTDFLAGYTLHRELELYTQAGIPPAEILRLATLTPAEILGIDKDRGIIAVGKRADMILVDGDPTRDISDIRKVETIVKGGKLYYRREIEAALGMHIGTPAR